MGDARGCSRREVVPSLEVWLSPLYFLRKSETKYSVYGLFYVFSAQGAGMDVSSIFATLNAKSGVPSLASASQIRGTQPATQNQSWDAPSKPPLAPRPAARDCDVVAAPLVAPDCEAVEHNHALYESQESGISEHNHNPSQDPKEDDGGAQLFTLKLLSSWGGAGAGTKVGGGRCDVCMQCVRVFSQ